MNSVRAQNGAVLLAVLIVSIILVLLIASSTLLMGHKLTIAQTSKSYVQQRLAVYSKVNELKYLVASQRATHKGISTGTNKKGAEQQDGLWKYRITGDELRADGYIYTEKVNDGENEDEIEVTYSIQADNGLIPINTSKQYWLERWFTNSGMEYFTTKKLLDRIADYADADDWSRPAGGESSVYLQNDLPAPPNYLYQNCKELTKVYEWELLAGEHSELVNYCRISRTATLNINAIPEALIKVLFPASYDAIITARNNNTWFLEIKSAIAAIPELTLLPEPYYSLAEQNYFHIAVSAPQYEEKWFLHRGSGTQSPLKSYRQQ